MSFQIKVVDTGLQFNGSLDESFDLKDFEKKVASFQEKNSGKDLALDFSRVDYANSSGMAKLVKAVDYFKSSCAYYLDAPVWLVRQISMIQGLITQKVYIQSFYVPYFCETSDAETTVLFRVGEDVPILADYSDYELPDQTIQGLSYEADISTASYLSFISTHYHYLQPFFKIGKCG